MLADKPREYTVIEWDAATGEQVTEPRIVRRLESGRWQSHAWFAGYAPSVAPRFAIVVLLEKGGGGGATGVRLGAVSGAAGAKGIMKNLLNVRWRADVTV